MNQTISINKYLPLALVYFFFNSFLLPEGMLYTTLLTPLLLVWLMRFKSFTYLLYFFYITVPFAFIHYINGTNTYYYLRSYILLGTVYIFCICFYQFLRECHSLRTIFRNLLMLNAIFVLVALVVLFIPAIREKLWLNSSLSYGLTGIMRLKLFTYEPSYYSLLLVPLAIYYYLKAAMKSLPDAWFMLLLITIPLLLSLSFGIILGTAIALLFTILVNFRSMFSLQQKLYIFLFILFATLVIGPIVISFFADNIFFQRIENVFIGRDSSFEGRTFDAFYLGYEIASMKSIWFGAGPGQVKVLGLELWTRYYQHAFTFDQVAIPNAMAETLALYGIVGTAIRLGLQVYFFFKTKVASNYYRLAIFTFAFIYQFTGSYLYNIAEYVVWILAFSPVFEEFNKKNYLKLRQS